MALLSSLFIGQRDREKADAVRRRLCSDLPSTTEAFSAAMVEGLPDPARRYLERSIAPGTPIPHRLELDFTGYIQFGVNAKPRPLGGRDSVVVPGRGYLWLESFVLSGLSRKGVLYYLDSEGEVCWSIAGLVADKAKRGEGANTTKAMRTRIMTHLLWTPWAFLPSRGARWEAIDDGSAKVFLNLDGTELEMTFHVEADGRLEKAIYPRWGAKTTDGSYAFFPFGLLPRGEAKFGGFTLPTPLDLVWCYGMPDRESPLLYRYELKRAEFR